MISRILYGLFIYFLKLCLWVVILGVSAFVILAFFTVRNG